MLRNRAWLPVAASLIGSGGGAVTALLAIGRDVAWGWSVLAFSMLGFGIGAMVTSLLGPGRRPCVWGYATGWRASSELAIHGPAPLRVLRIRNKKGRQLLGIKCSITNPDGESHEAENLFLPFGEVASERDLEYRFDAHELVHGRHHILWWGYEYETRKDAPFSPGKRRWLAHDSFKR